MKVLARILLVAVLTSLCSIAIHATGQGTIGIHAINDRYVLVTDSNVLSLIVVDVLLGGVAGILTFPTDFHKNETKKDNDIHFIGVTSCDTCLYIHVDKMHWQFPNSTEDHILEIGPLEKPLLEMAEDSNFTAFTSLSFKKDMKPVWPFPREYLDKEHTDDMRMIRSHPSGGVGYLARQRIGVLRYYLDSRGKMIQEGGDVFFRSKNSITGINFSSTYKQLVAVGKSIAYILDITDKKSHNASDYTIKSNLIEEISLTDTCIPGRYRNTVLWDDDPSSQVMIVDGHDGNPMKGGVGIVLQKLTRGNNGTWDNCEIVAGEKESVGWRDGCGSTARFTRPHDMTLLPNSGRLIVTDIDNRSIGLVQQNPLHNNNMTCVSTISYNEGLYMNLFPASQEEGVYNESNSTKTATSIENMNKNTVDVVVSETVPLREPYIPETLQMGTMTFQKAQAFCQSSSKSKNSDICTLKEVRTLFQYGDGNNNNNNYDDSLINDILSNPFWTKESCEGCWKRHKGICTNDDSSWDSNYRMVAVGMNLDSQSPNERGLRTECIHKDEIITPTFAQYIRVVCCADKGIVPKNEFEYSDNMKDGITLKNEFEYSDMLTLSLVAVSSVSVLVKLLYFLLAKMNPKEKR
eukprot:CAMPEP_0203675260 /NCGR_PEP_ID=MMETSP0090-20130426/19700_1 /ASSEMBLY_ACC=CAM_ASM_001088 /TAXON_ID=426623 /ORGANISM="Chaetoceros affinis, Strain CCMP159" /LENGTH=631 /DNA_ID=CAMNT_0050541405 /DNA_START=64 /DNA_END=1956 /DNA_ORIENTATION=+